MLKKSRIIAVLLACVMIFGVVETACARTWGEWFAETAAGGVIGAVVGGGIVLLTGGAALPVVAGCAAVGVAAGAADEDTRPVIVGGAIAIAGTVATGGVGAGAAAGSAGALGWLGKFFGNK